MNYSGHEDHELFEGTMHYFYCYELFSHKNLPDNYHFREVFEESHERKLANIRKGIDLPVHYLRVAERAKNRFEVLCSYNIALVTKSKDIPYERLF